MDAAKVGIKCSRGDMWTKGRMVANGRIERVHRSKHDLLSEQDLGNLPRASSRCGRASQARVSMSSSLRRTLLLALAWQPISAQSSVTIADEVSCGDCTIRISRVVTLGDTVGPGILGEHGTVWQAPDGTFYVETGIQRGTVLVFDADGRYWKSLGRRGGGPGEYLFPQVYHVSGDSVWIIDRARPRLTLHTSEEVETWGLPITATEALPVANGFHVFSAISRSSQFVGIPLFLFNSARAEITESFGNPSGVFHPTNPRQYVRRIAPARPGTFWATAINQYRIERWSTGGELLQVIERDAPWFQAWIRPAGPDYTVKPNPLFVGVRQSEDGLLWSFHRVADQAWTPQAPAVVRDSSHARATSAQKETLYDTIIEALDPGSGRLMARRQIQQNIIGTTGSDLFYSYEETGEGHPRYVVWRVELQHDEAIDGRTFSLNH